MLLSLVLLSACYTVEASSSEARPIDNPVLSLSSQIFDGNVLKPSGYAREWLVLYCLSWLESECAESEQAFKRLAGNFQKTYNNGLMTSEIRFAQVDCAKEKTLCNRMDVYSYPHVARYEAGKLASGKHAFWNGKVDDSKDSKFEIWARTPVEARQSMTMLGFLPNLWTSVQEAFTGTFAGRTGRSGARSESAYQLNIWQMVGVEPRALTGSFFLVLVTAFLFYFASLMKVEPACGKMLRGSSMGSEALQTLMPPAASVSAHGQVVEAPIGDQSMLL